MRVRLSRVVLVGLPGAGKTTVGQLVARQLLWSFVDTDRTVAAVAGLDIPAIFRTRGEAAFRALEASAMAAALGRDRVVVAAGGGWAAQPGALDGLPAETTLVWLQVSPEAAARRLRLDPAERPLVTQGDMVTRLEALQAERAPAYERAAIWLDTDGSTPEAVADRLATRLASEYGIDGRAD